MLVDVLFTVSTDDTCAVARVLGCSYSIYKMVDRAIYNWMDIVWGLGRVCQVGWRVGCWCPRGLFRTVGICVIVRREC